MHVSMSATGKTRLLCLYASHFVASTGISASTKSRVLEAIDRETTSCKGKCDDTLTIREAVLE
jgi:hypothetical protein